MVFRDRPVQAYRPLFEPVENVGAREQGSERGSHEILLVLGRQTTWAVDHILSTPGLSDDDRIAILGGTAVGLLGIKSSKGRDPQPARQNFRHPDRRSQVRSRLDGGGSRALRIAFRSPWTTRAKIQLPVGVDLRAARARSHFPSGNAPAILHDAPITVLLAVLLALGVPEKHDGCAL
jgi:hypothetical protein